MIKKIFLFLIILFSFTTLSIANDTNLTIGWNTKEGLIRLNRSQYNNDFYQLANFYQPQENPLYCGAATAIIILNASQYGQIASQKTGQIYKPQDIGGNLVPFNLYSQQDFFNENVKNIKKKEIIEFKAAKSYDNNDPIYDPGVNLSEYAKMLKYGHNFKVVKIHAERDNQKEIDRFRSHVKNVLSEDKKFLIVNYYGKKIGSTTGGHISPIAAYDEESDSILILDVALHKQKWFWVKIRDLYQAMHSKDGEKYRGYLIIRKK